MAGRNFMVSEIMPHPRSYNACEINPILETVSDQINQDPSMPFTNITCLRITNLILYALSINIIEWAPPPILGDCCKPMSFHKDQWMKLMDNCPIFYGRFTSCASVFRSYEAILLDLVSRLLKRKLCLVSYLPEERDEIIDPLGSSRIYYLFGCNKAHMGNFYVSIYPEDSQPNESKNSQVCM